MPKHYKSIEATQELASASCKNHTCTNCRLLLFMALGGWAVRMGVQSPTCRPAKSLDPIERTPQALCEQLSTFTIGLHATFAEHPRINMGCASVAGRCVFSLLGLPIQHLRCSAGPRNAAERPCARGAIRDPRS